MSSLHVLSLFQWILVAYIFLNRERLYKHLYKTLNNIKISQQPTAINSSADHFLPQSTLVHKISLKRGLAKYIALGVQIIEWKCLEALQLPSLVQPSQSPSPA